jgi:type IV secretion system protein TrbL
MHLMARLFTVLAVLMGGLLGLGGIAAGDPATSPSSDPVSDNYSPWAWMTAWDPTSATAAFNEVVTGDMRGGLEETGFVIAVQPEQFAALTPDDVTRLTQHWADGGLLSATFQRTQLWARDAVKSPSAVPVWSPGDADAVARDLGGTSYGSLSPGLKSIVQRVATIVTGDFKPPMPDDAWASWMSPEARAAFDARPDTRFDWSRVAISGDGAAGVRTVCDAGTLQWACLTTRAATEAVGAVVDFAADPLGWLTEKMAAGASGLMGWVSGVANAATAPDLTVGWWLDAYRKGMAVGVLLFGVVLMWQLLQKARGRIDAQELMEIFTVWAPAYFLGLIFGPPVAQFFIVGAGYLSDGLIGSMTGFSAGDAAAQVGAAIDDAGAGTILGGSVVALFVLVLVIIACILIFVSLAAQAVTIYLAGAVFGVAFAWIVSARHRGGSMKVPLLFLGIVFSRPLLFFLLGAGLALTREAVSMSGDTAAANLAILVMAVVVLCMAAFAPLLLLKFAPVNPTGMAAGGPTVGGPHSSAGRGPGLSRLGGMAASKAGRRTSTAAAGAAGTAAGAAAGVGSAGPSATSRAMSGAMPGGSVSQQLQRKPVQPGGTPSPQASRIAAAAPAKPAGWSSLTPTPGQGGRGSATGTPKPGDGAGAGSTVGGRPGATSGGSPHGSNSGAGAGSPRPAAAVAALAAPVSVAAAAGRTGSRTAHQLTDGLDGDREWAGGTS